MKSNLLLTFLLFVFGSALATEPLFIKGDPQIQSINALTFGPDNVLFIGDSKSAKIFALKTDHQNEKANFGELNIANVDKIIAAKLGTTAEQLTIQDMAVHPGSGLIYFAVHGPDETPVLVTINAEGSVEWVPLDDVYYSEKSIANAVAEDSKDNRGRSLRHWAISDLRFDNGNLYVSGLSNKEFGSTFRKMAYPFGPDQEDATLEIYHAAHGQFETHSPIKTFTTTQMNGETFVIASYTCTPLVLFPLSEMKQGEHVAGRTVAELGAGNTPLDMIIVEKDGRKLLLMANSNRPVMKISFDDIATYNGKLTTPVDIPGATAGVPYINFPMTNVVQLDKWGDSNWVMLKRQSNGELDLQSGNDFWL